MHTIRIQFSNVLFSDVLDGALLTKTITFYMNSASVRLNNRSKNVLTKALWTQLFVTLFTQSNDQEIAMSTKRKEKVKLLIQPV